jgi:hypothetical protein
MSDAIKKAYARNLVEGTATPDGYVSMTAGQIMEVAQYLAEVILPRLEFKKGVQSYDYKIFFLAINVCMRCIEQSEELERVRRKLHLTQQVLKFTREQLLIAEGELQKYTTVEDLIAGGGLENVIKIVQHQKFDFIKEALDRLNARKKMSG